jgi:tetratricopeptide (TPR) repeat protein
MNVKLSKKEDRKIKELIDSFYVEYNDEHYGAAITTLNRIVSLGENVDFWVYCRLSSCHYELLEYEKALSFAKKAFQMRPDSPLVLWDYAGPLIMLKKEREAIDLLKRIQSMSDNITYYGFTEPDINWMRTLKNDANFLIGKAYYTICEDVLAKKFLNNYLSNLARRGETIYSSEKALVYLKKIENVDDC